MAEKGKEKEESSNGFAELGVTKALVDSCNRLGFTKPTPIQAQSIPIALQGKDVIGLAETGSGKTVAFALPILQELLEKPAPFFACILAPTRELAVQIGEQFEALGADIGLRVGVVVGGVDMMSQAIVLSKKPHIVIGTPGRLVDHLENTKGFSLRSVRYLVLDEADRLLNLDFEEEIDTILRVLPQERRSFLFSATMTSKVNKLQRASLSNPVKVEVNAKYATVATLVQQYLFLPAKYKDCYLTYLLNEFAGSTTIVFVGTCATAQRLAIMLKSLTFQAVALHGQMSQPKRLASLNKFKSKARNILLATDVAARGLDIPNVDLVINYDMPAHSKDYIHRVGRTARAGKAGRALNLITQYDVELYQRIEHMMGKKLEEYETDEHTVLVLLERVSEAQRHAIMEMKEQQFKKKGGRGGFKGGRSEQDEEETETYGGSSFGGGGDAGGYAKRKGGGGRGRGRGGRSKRGRS